MIFIKYHTVLNICVSPSSTLFREFNFHCSKCHGSYLALYYMNVFISLRCNCNCGFNACNYLLVKYMDLCSIPKWHTPYTCYVYLAVILFYFNSLVISVLITKLNVCANGTYSHYMYCEY